MKEFCVDLEIAKELKKEGFPQETYFYHQINIHPTTEEEIYFNLIHTKYKENRGLSPIYSAPISDEILKELPNEINGYILEIIRYEDGTIEADYARSLWREEDVEYLIKSKKLFYKLPNCLAELWLDLKKEGYIK